MVALSALPAQQRVLVYTRNFVSSGKGYTHDNIATSVDAIRKIGRQSGFEVDTTDDPAVFTDAKLKPYSALVFSNSNNEAFTDDAQRDAFKTFIKSGKGFVGIHSASGSERKWPYFWSVLGGKFAFHPKMQTFEVRLVDPKFPGLNKLPQTFAWTDECYFNSNLSPSIHPILVTDRTRLTGLDKVPADPNTFPNPLPLCWYQQVEGGREFYLALGHRIDEYKDPILVDLIKSGILWALGKQEGAPSHASSN